MGVRRGYTHQMLITGQLGGTFVDPVARENRNGTRQLAGDRFRAPDRLGQFLLVKDGSGNEVHYDGIIKQMEASASASTNIIDMEGSPLDFETLENIGERLVSYGKLLNFDALRTFWKPRTLSDLAKLKLQAERRILGNDNVAGFVLACPSLATTRSMGTWRSKSRSSSIPSKMGSLSGGRCW